MPQRALITGINGQDGYLLNQLLLDRGVETFGIDRTGLIEGCTGERRDALDITERDQVAGLISELRPHEVYHLAAVHGSSQDGPGDPGVLMEQSFDVHVLALTNLLNALRVAHPAGRLLFAASSLVFGDPCQVPQTETTALAPINPYGISKAAGMQVCRYYREQHGTYAASAILYNHESSRRKENFISKKIVRSAVAIKRGTEKRLTVGNLGAKIDWGYAPDYVRAMKMMLDLEKPDDFIICTGTLHTVGAFVQHVFKQLDLEPDKYVDEDPALITREKRANDLVGDSGKLQRATGWAPSLSLREIAQEMVEAELKAQTAEKP